MWTHDACYNEAKKYTSIIDFEKKNRAAYDSARKNGWLSEYTWFEKLTNKWDKDSCYNAAKNCTSRTEFSRKYQRAYQLSLKNGWIKDYTWFQSRTNTNGNNYYVYCYFDKKNNAIYIGLTYDIDKRHAQHVNGKKRKGIVVYDSVAKYYNSIGKTPPKPKILKQCLSSEDAQYFEGYYVEVFKRRGLKVINIAKAGSLGGYSKWTKENCKTEAEKYKTRADFKKFAPGAFEFARKNGLLDSYTWLGKPFRWNKDACRDEAKKYKSRAEFCKNAQWGYNYARKNGWLDEFFPKTKA